jgi:mercuric ion transport protein
MTALVELVFDRTCPNADLAREQIRAALSATGLPDEWREWDRDAVDSPPYVRRYASPTVLVDGRDVAGGVGVAPLDGASGCRVYVDPVGGLTGVPPLAAIVAALFMSQRAAS